MKVSNVFSTVVLIEDTVNIQISKYFKKQTINSPKGCRLANWLFTQCDRAVELTTTENKSSRSNRVEDFSHGPPDFKSNTLNHSAMPRKRRSKTEYFSYMVL